MVNQSVSRETLEGAERRYMENRQRLDYYLESLLWWNERVNLVSRNVSRETLREHVVHSLIPLELGLLSGNDLWVDAGTGGGLPGVPLAITAGPEKRWIVNDLVQKKVVAVRQMSRLLGLDTVEVRGGSIASLNVDPGYGVVSKHAFSVAGLLELIGGEPWSRLIMYKGAGEARQESDRLADGYHSTLYTFEFGENEPFYREKGLLVIDRK